MTVAADHDRPTAPHPPGLPLPGERALSGRGRPSGVWPRFQAGEGGEGLSTVHLRIVLVVMALLAGAAVRAQEARVPLLSVPHSEEAPVVDGRLDDAAWEGAAGFAGMIPIGEKSLAPEVTRVRVLYTDERLYVAWECRFDAEAELQGVERERDTGRPWREDSVELFLLPGEQATREYYQLIANHAGSVYDLHTGRTQWDGDWQYATSTSAGVWYAEASLPFADLGRGTPAAGELWRANICRDVQAGRSSNESWAPLAASYIEPENFGWLRFAPGGVALRVEDLGEPAYGRLAVSGRALNGGDRPANLTVQASVVSAGTSLTAPGEDWAQFVQGKMETASQKLQVTPGGRAAVLVEREFSDRELNQIRVTATLADGGVIYARQVPIELRVPLSVHVRPVPMHRRLMVRVESGIEGVEPQATEAAVVVTGAGGARIARATATLAELDRGIALQYADWPEGAYEIAVTVAAGEEHSASARFEVLPEPEWLGRGLGTARVVLPPFEPLGYAGNAVECWGRRMEFGDASPLPGQITSQGEGVLSGPMRLLVTIGGEEVAVSADGPPRFRERAEDRAEFRTSGTVRPGLRAEIDWWSEFDGFTWADLTLDAPAGTTLEALALEFDVPPEVAQLLHGTADLRRGAFNEILEAGRSYDFPFLPLLWIGNHDRGLCWFTETMQGWAPEVSSEGVVIVRVDGEGGHVRINIIGEPVELEGERRWGFGLLASPVRPLPEGWSTWMCDKWPPGRSTLDWQALGAKPDAGIIWMTDFGRHLTAPLDTPESVAELVSLGEEWGVRVMHYIAPGTHSMAFDDPKRYFEEWRIEPLSEFYIPDFDETYPRLCLNSASWTDYLLHGIDRLIRDLGMHGIYHDGGAPALCSSEVHGCGWRDANNRLRHIRPIRAYREYHKRLATLFHHDHGREDFVIYDHTSDICWLPTLTFCDAHLDAEQYKGQRRAGVPYTEILSPTEIRPEYVSTQWGVITVFLNICSREGDEGRDCSATFLSYCLPYGIPFYPRHMLQEWNEQIQVLYAEFEIDSATFHPYWRGLPAIATDADFDETPVGVWTHADRGAVLAAGNVTGEARSVTLTLEEPAAIERVICSDVGVATDGNTLTLAMPPHSFALVWVR